MSDVMMRALQMQVESLTRQVEALAPENERVRKLLTEFDARHDEDQAKIWRLKRELSHVQMVNKCGDAIGGFDPDQRKTLGNE